MIADSRVKYPTMRLLRDQGGAALIEFTLIAPLLFSLVLGTVEFGRYLQQHHTMVKSARDATRYLSRTYMACAASGFFCCPATAASWGVAETNAKNLAMRGSTDPAAPLIISTWSDPTTVSFTVTCFDNSAGTYRKASAYNDPTNIPIVRTAISVPYTEVGFLSFFGFGALNITVDHQEVNFGE